MKQTVTDIRETRVGNKKVTCIATFHNGKCENIEVKIERRYTLEEFISL